MLQKHSRRYPPLSPTIELSINQLSIYSLQVRSALQLDSHEEALKALLPRTLSAGKQSKLKIVTFICIIKGAMRQLGNVNCIGPLIMPMYAVSNFRTKIGHKRPKAMSKDGQVTLTLAPEMDGKRAKRVPVILRNQGWGLESDKYLASEVTKETDICPQILGFWKQPY